MFSRISIDKLITKLQNQNKINNSRNKILVVLSYTFELFGVYGAIISNKDQHKNSMKKFVFQHFKS